MNEHDTDEAEVGGLPDVDFDLFAKATFAALTGIFQRGQNSAGPEAVAAAISNAMQIGFEAEKQMRPVKTASQKRGRK